MRPLDAIYVTASAKDGRYTRICVASIRHFYPDAPIRLLIGGTLEDGLQDELARYWDVGVSAVPPGQWGWGFVKLEPLFGPPGERFMVLDSDTVFGGPALSAWDTGSADFMVDDEPQDDEAIRRLYYDWDRAREVDPEVEKPAFVFNSGQWFGTAGVLTREDFALTMDWSAMPPKARRPDCFKNGEQGVLNYVLNRKAREGMAVDRRRIMRWPGHGLDGFTARSVAERTAPARVIHWAGYKAPRLADLPGTDVLRYLEELYYSRLPGGTLRRAAGRVRYPLRYWTPKVKNRLGLK